VQNGGRGGAMLTHNELMFYFWGFLRLYVYANFGENRTRNATRESAHRRIHRYTDRRKPVIICLMLYGADNKELMIQLYKTLIRP